jgi:hypothetical protein
VKKQNPRTEGREISMKTAPVVHVAAILLCAAGLPSPAVDWMRHLQSGQPVHVVLDRTADKFDDREFKGHGDPMGTLRGGDTYTVVWDDGVFVCTGFNQGTGQIGTWKYSNADLAKRQLSLWGRPVKFKRNGRVLDPEYGWVGHLRTIETNGVRRRGLLLYYPFDRDEGGRVTDRSGWGHDGLAEDVTWVAGEAGGAVRLGASKSAIRIPHNANLNTPDALSLFVRIKGDRLSAGTHANVARSLINKFDSNSRDPTRAPTLAAGWFLQVHAWKTAEGELSCGLWNGATGAALSGSTPVADGEWHQIGFVYRGGDEPSVTLYVDGRADSVSQQGGEIPAAIRNNESDVWIGRWAFDAIHPPFKGELDDVMIFNRALTDEDVRALFLEAH